MVRKSATDYLARRSSNVDRLVAPTPGCDEPLHSPLVSEYERATLNGSCDEFNVFVLSPRGYRRHRGDVQPEVERVPPRMRCVEQQHIVGSGMPDPASVGEALGREDIKQCRIEDHSPMARSPEIREKPGFLILCSYTENVADGIADGLGVVRARSTGGYYLRLPAQEITTSNILALYLVAFATATLVRYHPGYWTLLIRRSQGAYITPILSAAVDVVEEQFPCLVLERLG
ncbi:hypothetical protein SAMN00767673_3246 [Rubrobacter radiotolerans DSM 5868]|nr:hypothetical protein SAMN00767673_3246 [Rubrobacter radiotolerans DSM 5868]